MEKTNYYARHTKTSYEQQLIALVALGGNSSSMITNHDAYLMHTWMLLHSS